MEVGIRLEGPTVDGITGQAAGVGNEVEDIEICLSCFSVGDILQKLF